MMVHHNDYLLYPYSKRLQQKPHISNLEELKSFERLSHGYIFKYLKKLFHTCKYLRMAGRGSGIPIFGKCSNVKRVINARFYKLFSIAIVYTRIV